MPAAPPLSPTYPSPQASPPAGRAPAHDLGRRLRGSARWLGAAGLAWYLFGRVLQGAGLGLGGDSEVPNWWWAGTALLLTAGGAVWLGRRQLRWSDARAAGSAAEPADVLEAWGFQVSRPGGEWVRSFAPESFRSSEEIAGPSIWPWGPDPRGFHELLHPRAMEPILRDLPEGATLRFDRDRIAVYNDEPVRSNELATYLGLMHQLADLLPSYLVER